ncbi:AIFM3 isoform 3 [Pongo abelii]|uniref:AIFM3 isoform 3 n=1 Tax=Pongo abelii TaxID=9601 RepID=A0A2J8RZG2_PONAB|nr:AIFM3 isoform 3 [Pongo abelii]
MGGCFSKPKPVELKIEVVLPEKERGKEELSASGKGSPRAYQGNGTARHFHTEERLSTPHPYPSPQDCVEAAVCHVKDLENGQRSVPWSGALPLARRLLQHQHWGPGGLPRPGQSAQVPGED